MKGILWFVEREISKRKRVVIRFRKLVKNWKNKINEEEISGKIWSEFIRGREEEVRQRNKGWRVQIVCSEFGSVLAPLLRNAFLGHEKYCKNKIFFNGICVSTGWFIKACGRNGHPVTQDAEFQKQLLCLWDNCCQLGSSLCDHRKFSWEAEHPMRGQSHFLDLIILRWIICTWYWWL